MGRLIDIHCHMLGGVDDGSDSLETSLDMARMSYESGVGQVILTPHSIPGMFENYAGEELEERFDEFKNALAENGIPLKIHMGMEVFGSGQTKDDLKNKRLYTLAGSGYMLIEFDFGEDPHFVNYILSAVADNGYIPVIAHPERYHFVAEDPRLLFKWSERGYLMQCNKDSVLGRFGRMVKAISHDMLVDNLYSFFGSDAHGTVHRTSGLSYAFDEVADLCGVDYAEKIFIENPTKLIEGQKIY